jgi:hypothetical protein
MSAMRFGGWGDAWRIAWRRLAVAIRRILTGDDFAERYSIAGELDCIHFDTNLRLRAVRHFGTGLQRCS